MTISSLPPNLHYEFTLPQQDEQEANVRFNSVFKGKKVSWHAKIMTLQRYRDEFLKETNQELPVQQFIEISQGGSTEDYNLVVTLAVERIDHPTILKTIIMIQNYKRLAFGRHEFGPHIGI